MSRIKMLRRMSIIYICICVCVCVFGQMCVLPWQALFQKVLFHLLVSKHHRWPQEVWQPPQDILHKQAKSKIQFLLIKTIAIPLITTNTEENTRSPI